MVRDFTCSLVGQEDSQIAGWGRPYCRQSPRSLQNQDFEEDDDDDNILAACAARMLSPFFSLESCPNKENILVWSWAGREIQPAMKNTTVASVA